MKQAIKKLAFKLYKLINHIPFNNKRKGKIQIVNDGSILMHCKIISTGTENRLVFRGGYTETVSLFSTEIITL